jgi:hypothetical protein
LDLLIPELLALADRYDRTVAQPLRGNRGKYGSDELDEFVMRLETYKASLKEERDGRGR